MKPTSIIFTILSAVLIVAGIITCYAANNIAEASNINLFYETTDEKNDHIESYDFKEDDISRISLNLTDADVYIYGKSDESMISLKNFDMNSITYTKNNKVISVDDSSSLLYLVKTSESGISFNSLRSLMMNFRTAQQAKRKAVEIHIGETDQIKVYNISLSSGNLYIDNISASADYSLNIGSGNVEIKNVSTQSKLDITLGNGDLTVLDTTFSDGNFKISKGNLTQNIISDGNLSFDFNAPDGNIDVNGISHHNTYRFSSDDAKSVLKADVLSGNITISEETEINKK